MTFRRAFLAFTMLAAVVGASSAQACFMRSPQPVQVWLDHILVEITDRVAVKTYNCTFLNPNPQAVVGGTCYMELEPGAQIDNMSVLVDGKEMQAEILDVEKANQVFTEMVKEGGSPALLEYYGNQLIQTKIPRVAPGGTVTVKLKYTMLLPSRGGVTRLQMLNTNPKALMQPLKSAGVTVNIRSKEPLKNIYSPTHAIKLVEKEDWDISVQWSQENYLPKHPFVLYYQTSDEPVAASLLAHRESGEDGHFLLMLSPTLGGSASEASDAEILPKDVVFCVDTSGSMLEADKMEQARKGLRYCVEHLREGDRFNIVNFGTTVRSFDDAGLMPFNGSSKRRALEFVNRLNARGGTAISEALDRSLKLLKGARGKEGRLQMIVFATDGLPTIGERDPEAILKQVEKQNDNVRLFVFGHGKDVNTRLLDLLALNNRGEADYALEDAQIAATNGDRSITDKMAHLFDRVGSPILTDLEVTFEGLEVDDVFPRSIPDVFRGEQVIVYGRYDGYGSKTVVLRGKGAGGVEREFRYELSLPATSEDDKASFVPRLWAGQKVDFLLTEIRKQDKLDKELVEEVTELAKLYGIVTPYTSFLVADDRLPQLAQREMLMEGREDALSRQFGLQRGAALGGAAEESAGQDSANYFRTAKARAGARLSLQDSGAADAMYAQADEELRAVGRDVSSLSAIRYIGSRTFYHRGGEWHDSRFDPERQKDLETVEVGSKKYFDLLKQAPDAAKYLALGDVVVEVKGRWYRVSARRSS